MKKFTFTLLALFLLCSVKAQQLAFPGAEGFGKNAVGGRYGSVYHVTNLNDSGTGSLRDAVSQPNRIVVFDVGGIIKIKERLIFSNNLYVAGQTAPGEGICVYGNGVSFSAANDIICRYIRFRMGLGGEDGKDAAGIANGKNMIFDHVSVSWGRDENFSISWDGKGSEPGNITIQNSIISQGILIHAMGGLMQTAGGVTLLRNLYIDNKSRNPKVKGLNQFVNNVVYNWGSDGYILGDSEGPSWATIENCYFMKGPDSNSPFTRANANFQLYQSGNYVDGNKDGIMNGALAAQDDYGPATFVSSYSNFSNCPIPHPVLANQMTAAETYQWIIDNAGTTLPVRDQVDNYLMDEVRSYGAKGALVSSELELGLNGPGLVFGGNKLTDTDNDGMPDIWEEANGTSKTVNDAMTIGSDGYANIERYINSITTYQPYLRYPINPIVTRVDKTEMDLTWSEYSNDENGFVLEMSTNDTTYAPIDTVDANVTSTTIKGLKMNTKYYFRLKAFNETLQSLYSAKTSATTRGDLAVPYPSVTPTPAIGTNLTTNKNISLSWTNPSTTDGGIVYYDVLLGTNPDSLSVVSSNKSLKSYTLPLLDQFTTYYWKVNAHNLIGATESNVWSFTTGGVKVHPLVLHLPFDETSGTVAVNAAADYDASVTNMTPGWTSGKTNNALQLPGTPTNQYLTCPNYSDILFNQQSFTISLWFKSAGGSVDWYLLHKGSHTKNTATGATGKWFGIQYKSNNLTFGVDDDVTKTTVDVAASAYFNNQWTHLVCIRDYENKKLRMYLNGVLKLEKTDATTTGIGEATPLIIGNCNVNFNTPFNGSLDDLRMYSEAITTEEVAELYNSYTTLGVEKVLKGNSSLVVSPNPFSEQLNINYFATTGGQGTITLIDLTGRTVLSTARELLPQENNRIVIDNLSTLSPGIYTCIVKENNSVSVQKVIKTK